MLVCGVLAGWLMYAQPPTVTPTETVYGTILEALNQSELLDIRDIEHEVMPEWYCRLENPARALEFEDMPLHNSDTIDNIARRANEVKEQVEAIVAVADIWNIDLRVDGIGTRMARALAESSRGRTLGASVACTILGEDNPDAGTLSRTREICVCYSDRMAAESDVRQLEETEEGVTSDARLWDEIEKRVREAMIIGLRDGRTLVDNPGLRQDFNLLSTRDIRPFRTFTVQETSENIEIWIAAQPPCDQTRVDIKWVNMEDSTSAPTTIRIEPHD